jgi:predicted deacylase
MTSRGGAFEPAELTGPEQGPVISLIGGVHGEEEEGVLAVQRVCARLRETPLRRGTLRAVAVAHPHGRRAVSLTRYCFVVRAVPRPQESGSTTSTS